MSNLAKLNLTKYGNDPKKIAQAVLAGEITMQEAVFNGQLAQCAECREGLP